MIHEVIQWAGSAGYKAHVLWASHLPRREKVPSLPISLHPKRPREGESTRQTKLSTTLGVRPVLVGQMLWEGPASRSCSLKEADYEW